MLARGTRQFINATKSKRGPKLLADTQPYAAKSGPAFSIVTANYYHSKSLDYLTMVGGPSTQACAISAVEKGLISPGQVIVIGSVSWLQGVHQDWYLKPWGQSKRYLPPPMRVIADNLFPTFPDDDLLNFGMMKEITINLENRIQELGIERYKFEVDTFKEHHDGGLVAVHGDKEVVVCDTERYEVFNSSIIPGNIRQLPANHCGYAYHYSKSESTENAIVTGSGANLTWIVRDEAEIRNVIHLHITGERLREDIYDKLHCSMNIAKCKIHTSTDDSVVVEGYDEVSKNQMVVRASASQVYSAIGFRFNKDIVANLDPRKVQNIDTTPSANNLILAHSLNRKSSVKPNDLRGSVVPPGNLLTNFFRIQQALGHYKHSAANAIIAFDCFEQTLVEAAVAHNVYFEDTSIFDWLKPKVREAYSSGIPSEETILRLIKSAYESKETSPVYKVTHENELEYKREPLSVDDFMSLVKAPAHEVIEAYKKVAEEEPPKDEDTDTLGMS